jgi:hypothetical protein
MGMDQYLLIPFLVGWTSIYQLYWCSPGVQGFDTLPVGFTILLINLPSGNVAIEHGPSRNSGFSHEKMVIHTQLWGWVKISDLGDHNNLGDF